MNRERLWYLALFLCLTGAEVYIGACVHDDLIRPYGGDTLAVIVLWALVRCFVPRGVRWLPGALFAFACAVEASQALHLADRLGVTGRFLRTVLGTSFAWGDILAYAVGCLFLAALERAIFGRGKR